MLPKLPAIKVSKDLKNKENDAVVIVSSGVKSIANKDLRDPVAAICDLDKTAEEGVFLTASKLPSKRIVFSGTGPLDKDYDDVRKFEDAAEKGLKKALAAGSNFPMVKIIESEKFKRSQLVSMLGCLKALYVPLEVREQVPEKAEKVKGLNFFVDGSDEKHLQGDIELATAIEMGRIVSRDIGGSDPERMAAPRVEEYVRKAFEGTGVTVEVVSGQKKLEKEYPCFAAVNRAASQVERHDGRVIWLTYTPPGPVEKTVMLVGKGVTYDTGGADIKAGGIMAGMSRDKCGSSVVAGFLKTASILKPKNVKVIGAMAMVRNSVGSNCYVADEIITARSGVRLRVGNTDAEGRMAMVDVLCHMKEKALKETNPHLMTIATLTGHEVLAYGPYTAIMDNGPARADGFAQKVQAAGDECGDMFEISTIRREDYDMIMDKSRAFVDVLQCNNAASSRTPRGHQFPAAFMDYVSGLEKHMLSSKQPLKYSHLDVAGSSGHLPEPTTAAGVASLAIHYLV